MNKPRKRGTRVGAAGFVISVLAACGSCGGAFDGLGGGSAAGGALGNLACPELQGGAENANFEADAKANATIRAFVLASGDLARVAASVESEVAGACEGMGRDLGIDPQQMAPRPNESRVTAACTAVSTKMDAILKTGVSASIKANYTPPQCRVEASAEASCKGQCSAHVDPGYVKAHCEPGHLYGRCDGTCTGQCNGSCQGECQGECQGAAAAGAASGHCAGQCRGTCKGTCSADCHGACTVDIKEPKCDVAIKEPSADAHCDGSCKAHAELTAQCTEPRVNVVASVNTGEMSKLIATLSAHLPALIKAELAYGNRIGGDVQMLVQTGADLPNAFGQLTAHAGACIAAAANACVSAQASLRVSVQVSASVSAKAGAHGSV